MINSALLHVDTQVKEGLGKVTIVTPNGIHHDIEGTNLECVAAGLRDRGYNFTYPDTTTLKITHLPKSKPEATPPSVQELASL